jgi:hypothetical protein
MSLRKLALCSAAMALFAVTPLALLAQSDATITPTAAPVGGTAAATSTVPHFVKYSGTLPDSAGSTVSLRFSLYAAQTGGDPIWSELQSVTLTDQGKYSVLLGSTTASGLPQILFTTGAAHWLSVTPQAASQDAQSEADSTASPRTLLLATPYALKASDSDTLAGHPITDFSLINSGKPETGTDITQINVGTGLTGGGTGPTVAVGLASNVLTSLTGSNGLEVTRSGGAYNVTVGPGVITLGNNYYAQLAAANTFTKAQTFNAGVTFASGQTFPGTATLAGNNTFAGTNAFSKAMTFASGQTFPGTATLAGNNTFAGTNTFSKAVAFASGQTFAGLPTLAGINTFAATNTFDGVIFSDLQLFGEVSDSTYYAVVGENIAAAPSFGVFGSGATIGVSGTATDTAEGDTATGVFGKSDNISGLGVYGVNTAASTEGTYYGPYGAAIWADTSSTFTALLATADASSDAGTFYNNSNYTTLYAENDTTLTGENATIFSTYSGSNGEACLIYVNGVMSCSGGYATSVPVENNSRKVRTFATQSTESWFEDAGSGTLSAGVAHVTLDHTFAETVNANVDYHVFLTPNGDCKGLYIASKGPEGFEVRELGGGKSSIAFDYRIMAKRRGHEAERLTDVTDHEKLHPLTPPHRSLPGVHHPMVSPPIALPVPVPAAALKPSSHSNEK